MNLQPALKGTKPIKFGILIVCEDSKGNFQYIKDKVSSFQPKTSAIIIDFEFANSNDAQGAQVHKLMQYAINRTKVLNEQYYNGGEEPEAFFYKKMYCVSDVDDNYIKDGILQPNIPKVLSLLEQAKNENSPVQYELLLSNECFEIWYILHFQDIAEPLYRGTHDQKNSGLWKADKSNDISEIVKTTTGISKTKKKNSLDFFIVLQEKGNEQKAIERAKKLESEALSRGNIYELSGNPATEIYKLIEFLNEL